ncbi:MAG: J domain-containing protein [Bradymonadia bacterium]|jgi:hypothetical protein
MAKNTSKKSVFSFVQSALDKGAKLTMKAANAAQSAVESSPKLKGAKEKIKDFGKRQGQKISNFSIHGLRLEDVGEMSYRYTQRRLLQLLDLLEQIDPNISIQNLGNSDIPALFKAYQTLGLKYGASYDDVKKAYREKMRAHHPDRHANDPDREREATLKSQAITEAFDIIQKHMGKG